MDIYNKDCKYGTTSGWSGNILVLLRASAADMCWMRTLKDDHSKASNLPDFPGKTFVSMNLSNYV